jgi:hypothetical protein
LFCLFDSALDTTTDNIFRFNTKNPDAVISVMDESLELNRDTRCDLYSGISSSEFSLALHDRKQNKFLAMEVFRNELSDPSQQVQWLHEVSGKSDLLKKNKFRTTTVSVINEFTTLVPSALFQKEDAEKYFHFNFDAKEVKVHSETIRAFDVVNVFAVSGPMVKAMDQIFDEPVIHHHTTALLEGVHLTFKKSNEQKVLLNVRREYVDIIVTENGKLVFINSFNCRNADDLVYYVLFVCDRLQLNPETVSMYVTGDVETESALYMLLYKYIRNISFAPGYDVFEFSYVFKGLPSHHYFNLYSLALCGS